MTKEPSGVFFQSQYDGASRHWMFIEPTGAISTTVYDNDRRAVQRLGRR